MKWSGAGVRHAIKTSQVQVFSIKEVVTGKYLRESKSGELQFSDFDDEDQAFAHWKLKPLDADTELYEHEKTKFMLQNAQSGNVLRLGKQDRALEQEADGQDMEDTQQAMFALELRPEDEVNEDDVFVFRGLSQEWLDVFHHIRQELTLLTDIKDALMEANPAMKDHVPTVAKQVRLNRIATRRKQKKNDKEIIDHRRAGIQFINDEYLFPNPGSQKAADPDSGQVYSGDMLESLERLLYRVVPHSIDPNFLRRDGIPDVAVQDLLCEVRMVAFIQELLSDALFPLVSQQEVMAGAVGGDDVVGPYFLRVVKYCFRLLSVMAKDHAGNSRILFRHVDFIKSHLGYNFEAASTLTEIFRNDRELALNVDSRFIDEVWAKACEQRKPRYLQFFCQLISAGGEPIKFNQDRLIKIVKDNQVAP